MFSETFMMFPRAEVSICPRFQGTLSESFASLALPAYEEIMRQSSEITEWRRAAVMTHEWLNIRCRGRAVPLGNPGLGYPDAQEGVNALLG